MDSKHRSQVAVLSINNQHYPIYEGVNTIGRNREAIVNLRHMNISQNHAIIVIVNGQHFISDLKSSNGSICEDSKMVPFKLYQLKDNAKVTLGNLLGTYVSEGPFPNENNFSQSSLAPSQSFYGCNTQLLECSASQDLDIHEAATQEMCWSSFKHKTALAKKANLVQSDDNFIVPPNPPPLKEAMLNLSDDFNDENLPTLENFSENMVYANKQQAMQEEETEIVEIKKSTEEDDELTDCEEGGPIKLENISHSEVNTSLAVSDKLAATKTSPDSDENSSDSMEFLKTEKSPVKIINEKNANGSPNGEDKNLNTDSDTENLTFKRSKKSLMVISTQDFTDESLNLQINESETDNSIVRNSTDKKSYYNDSCSDSVMELRVSDNFEDVIPATQDFNDSDFIPATQHPNKLSSVGETQNKNKNSELSEGAGETQNKNKNGELSEAAGESQIKNKNGELSEGAGESQNKNKNGELSEGAGESQNKNKNIGLSEESFKLGLTEMMTDSETVNNLDKPPSLHIRPENEAELDIYNVPTQKFISDISTNRDDIFSAPTQKIIHNNENGDDTFLAPTQKIFHGNISNHSETMRTADDTFLAPTQKIIHNRGDEETKFCSDTQDTDIYDCPTQKVDFNTSIQELTKPAASVKLHIASIPDTENIFDCPTQVLAVNAPAPITETNIPSKSQDSTEIYDAPTQKMYTDSKEIEENVCATENSIDETYSAPTQKIIIGFKAGEDKNNSTEPIKEEPSTNNKRNKKTFSFKKKVCNLDASLSILADDNAFKVPKAKSDSVGKPEANPQNDNITVRSKERKAASDHESDVDSGKESKPGDVSTPKANADTSSKSDDLTESTLNATSSEVNKSMALFESKIKKTRKSSKAVDINVTVPKNRRSMTIAKVEELPTTLKDSNSDNDPSSSDGRRASKRRNTTKKQAAESTDSKSRRTKGDALADTSRRSKTIKVAEKNKNTTDTSDENIPSVDNGSRQTTQVKRPSRRKVRSFSNNNNVSEDSSDVKAGTSSDEPDKATKITKRKKSFPDVAVDQSVSSPKKQRLQLNDTITDAAQRGLRKQRPKVVFTMLESPRLESLIKQLGGTIVDSVETGTVVVTERVKRSQKLLTAVGLGKPICSPNWITDSKKSQEFLDPWDYILTDAEAEKKWDFSLKESLNRSKAQKLLESYSFYIQVTSGADVLKGAIEACGGKCITKIPSAPLENAFIISSNEHQSKYSRILKKHPHFTAVEAEAIFDGVLRQQLRFSRHILK